MAFRSVTAATTAAAASITITKPSGTINGDVLIAAVGSQLGAAITAPAGWTQLGTEQVLGVVRAAFFYKQALGEGASYIFSSAAATFMQGAMACYSGRFTGAAPTDGVTTATSASGTSHAVTGFTTTTDRDDLVTAYLALVAACTYTAPAGETERDDTSNQELNDETQTTAGATGTKTATSSVVNQCAMLLVAFKPEVNVEVLRGLPPPAREHFTPAWFP